MSHWELFHLSGIQQIGTGKRHAMREPPIDPHKMDFHNRFVKSPAEMVSSKLKISFPCRIPETRREGTVSMRHSGLPRDKFFSHPAAEISAEKIPFPLKIQAVPHSFRKSHMRV